MTGSSWQGAEASVSRDGTAVVKVRKEKSYRQPELDDRLRTERTQQEARLLEKAGTVGVPVPSVLSSEETMIEMEYLDGMPLSEVMEDATEVWPKIGRYVAQLHENNIIHGDLTTSNMILLDGDLYLIDFGLGFYSDRIEDRATDLRLLSQVLHASHHTVAVEAFDVIADRYCECSDNGEAVMEQLDAIAERGRYR